MRQNIIFCAATLIAALVAAGCTKDGTRHADASSLTIGVLGEAHSLNPLLEEGSVSGTIGPLIFSYLLTVDARGRLQPDLAQAIPSAGNRGISPDGETVTYHLRHGVRWQDGKPLTSSDVVYTYDLIMNPSTNVPSRTGYDRIATVTAPDAYTVRVRLKRRFSPVLSDFFAPDTNYPVLPKHVLKAHPDINHGAFNTMPIGSGPYRVEQWSRGDYIRFAANPTYFGGAPSIAHLMLKTVPSVTTMYDELHTGELDAAFPTVAQYAHDFRPIPGVSAVKKRTGGAVLLIFNVASARLSDPRVRRALAQGVDYARIVHAATRGIQSHDDAAGGLFGAAYDASVRPLPFDLSRAKALLDAAGWRGGAAGLRYHDGVPFELLYTYDLQETEGTDFGVLLQQALRALGVKLTLRGYATQMFTAPANDGGPLLSGRFEMAFVQLIPQTDPDMSWFFGCDQMPPNGFNLSRFCDPQTTEADAESIANYDWSQRRRESIVIQRRVVDEVPLIPLWQQGQVVVRIDALQGVDPSPASPLWNVARWRLQR